MKEGGRGRDKERGGMERRGERARPRERERERERERCMQSNPAHHVRQALSKKIPSIPIKAFLRDETTRDNHFLRDNGGWEGWQRS